jgi:hypothetical protein
MPRFVKDSLLTLAVIALVSLAHGTAQAAPISVCTGSGCSTANVSEIIVAGNGPATINGVDFQVSRGMLGAVSLFGTSSTNPTNILAGTVRFTLIVPEVTENSTFSNVVIQLGTEAAPPGPGTST